MFDYDFNRERIFLEIAEAEIAAMRKTEDEETVVAVSEYDDLDDGLVRQVRCICTSCNTHGLVVSHPCWSFLLV